ncbi:MAG: fatty acid desaturase [Candidatus Neomarinimicrobiota bacterium]|nr:MAG: fatty acid desaturase [Candidatus Neomarinimicrobiota bacterium]
MFSPNSLRNDTPERKPVRKWPAWYAALKSYRRASARTAAWQLINTLLPYGLVWVLMIWWLQEGYAYGWMLLLAFLAALFLVRIFILFHDCVHGSLFPSPKVNHFFGHLLGLLLFTPFEDWRLSHLRHHATYADLDERGFGDIWTLTRTEYERAPFLTRLAYRLYRNPVVLLGLGPVFSFLLRFRLPTRQSKPRARTSVLLTNLVIVLVLVVAARTIGLRTYILIQLPVIWLAGMMGIWLFYVQHQFQGVYWARREDWDPVRAALEGCSFYHLPALLRWFSANIGYHHIHHLSPRIPNYRLKQCHEAVPELRRQPPLTLRDSLGAIRLKLWDEDRQQLIAFP